MAITDIEIASDFPEEHFGLDETDDSYDTRQLEANAVSWGAVIAGATAAGALSLILLILGTGLGLSAVSPWSPGNNATAFGISTIVWIILAQLAASAMGGYLAGRLRTRWEGVHTDEVYFRDTVHGFLAWAIASLATAALLTSVIGSILGGGIRAGTSLAGSVATSASAASSGGVIAMPRNDSGPIRYFVDTLFRKDPNATATISPLPADAVGSAEPLMPVTEESSAEVSRIFMNTLQTGPLSAEDLQYTGELVSQRTGLSQQDAEKRVSEVYARLQTKLQNAEGAARDAAEKARKASAYTSLWLFISLLIGAFIASLAATYGGRRRDVPYT